MERLPSISVVIPARNRPRDLADLVGTILNQDVSPYEVIIVDGSDNDSVKKVVDAFKCKIDSNGGRLKYIEARGESLTSARNMGVTASRGDAILFLDDDTLLSQDVIGKLAIFLRDNPTALGAQPWVTRPEEKGPNVRFSEKLEQALFKVLMLSYPEKNRMGIRRSGWSIFPSELTSIISVQRFLGCGFCYRREVFTELSFDTNLKGWAYLEDVDFSYRVCLKKPHSLYAVPYIRIIHKTSENLRLPLKEFMLMTVTYWFYIFFKDVFRGSILNLLAFLYALNGYLISTIGGLILKRKLKPEWWALVYLVSSYYKSFSNLRSILSRNLDFFDQTLNQ